MSSLSGGHIVVEILEREGVEKAFCVPGESYLGVIDGLYEHPDIDLIATRHEGGASFMAEAYAKATGKVGVCMATRGPGATNLSIGLHTAMQDSSPVVALIGQVERPYLEKEAFQEVDFKAFFSHLCKWSVEIDSVERIPELLHRAFYTARSGRPGPVVVSLPHDMLEDLTEYLDSKPISFNQPVADEETVTRVLKRIDEANQPLIIAGGGIISGNAKDEFRRFVEKIKVPVATSYRRFDVLDNTHENYAGSLGFSIDPKLGDYIKSADLIISLGTRLSQVTTQNYSLLGESPNIIQIDISDLSIGKSYDVEMGVISDSKGFLKTALQVLEKQPVTKDKKLIKAYHDNYLEYSTLPIINNDGKYAELESVINDISNKTGKNTIITGDAGNFHGWLTRYFRFADTMKYIGPISGAMGYGLPAAIGAKIAYPNNTVISFSGDGGFMMTIQELETAVREKVKIIAIVVNNNMFGTIREHQEKHFPGRVNATALSNPDFSELAKIYGCNAAKVTKNKEFLGAFEEALKSELPYVIEIQTDPDLLSIGNKKK